MLPVPFASSLTEKFNENLRAEVQRVDARIAEIQQENPGEANHTLHMLVDTDLSAYVERHFIRRGYAVTLTATRALAADTGCDKITLSWSRR